MWNDIHPSEEWIDGNLPEVSSISKEKHQEKYDSHLIAWIFSTCEYFDLLGILLCIHMLHIICFQIVKKYAFQKQKFRDDPNCDIDFETMRLVSCGLFMLFATTIPTILSVLGQWHGEVVVHSFVACDCDYNQHFHQ